MLARDFFQSQKDRESILMSLVKEEVSTLTNNFHKILNGVDVSIFKMKSDGLISMEVTDSCYLNISLDNTAGYLFIEITECIKKDKRYITRQDKEIVVIDSFLAAKIYNGEEVEIASEKVLDSEAKDFLVLKLKRS